MYLRLRYTIYMFIKTLFGFLLFLFSFFSVSTALDAQDSVLKISYKGAIGPPVVTVFENIATKAKALKVAAILVELDTPGGLAESMRAINQQILASDIPYIIYVSPKGARAASAGTFMLYASHVAAMAPTTTLGAASPVSIMGGGNNPLDSKKEADEKQMNQQETMMKKVTNDATASIRAMAELRGRNADWAESAVRKAESLSAKDALAKKVIDIVAEDEADLLEQLKGFSIKMGKDKAPIVLQIGEVIAYEYSFKETFLLALFNPNLLYIFILVGIYGIIFEFSSPGVGLPGVAGLICLALAGFGMQMLPLNGFGIAMIIIGTIFLIYEVVTPSFGLFGSVAVVLLAVGGWFLIDTSVANVQVDLPVILGATAINMFAFGFLAYVIYLTRKKNKSFVALLGRVATVRVADSMKGQVYIDGERWQYRSEDSLKINDEVEIVKQEGLILDVKKIPSDTK